MTVLIISLLIGKDFTFDPLNSHRYIGNIVTSKNVILGSVPCILLELLYH